MGEGIGRERNEGGNGVLRVAMTKLMGLGLGQYGRDGRDGLSAQSPRGVFTSWMAKPFLRGIKKFPKRFDGKGE